MKYSVYIIQDRDKTNQDLFNDLASDAGFGKHVMNAAINATNDLMNADFFDPYASEKVLGKNGVAINDAMIDSVSIKKESIKKEMFTEGTNRFDFFTVTTITVKGSLFAPSLIEMKSKTVKNKDMSRVMAWANLAPKRLVLEDNNHEYSGDINNEHDEVKLKPSIQSDYGDNHPKYYYRRVLVTSYSDTDKRFRAVLHDKVFVSSYEEVYDDKDGNGKFTLVMQSVAACVFDVFVAGPTYTWSLVSVTDEVSSVVQKHTKTTNKVVETVDKIAGTSIAGKVENVTGKMDFVAKTADSLKADDGITVESLYEHVGNQKDAFFSDQTQKAIEQAAKYKEAYGKLTDDQKDTLKNIPGFDGMSIKDKMKYIKKLTGEK